MHFAGKRGEPNRARAVAKHGVGLASDQAITELERIMRKLSVGLVAVCMSISGQAFADIGEQGQLAVGAERMMGYTYGTQSSEPDGGTTTDKTSTFSLLGFMYNNYSFPRFAIDYFVTDGLSLGGSLVYANIGNTTEFEPDDGPSDESGSSTSIFVLAPRVGYVYMFTDGIGIWPRGGITYASQSFDDDDSDAESSQSNVALTIEAPFLFAPTDNIAFTAGPTIDYGLSYSGESTNSDGDTTKDEDTNPAHEFGLQAGLTVFF